jgi:hypothetical protein
VKQTRPLEVNGDAGPKAEGIGSAAAFITGVRTAELRAIYAEGRSVSTAA